MKKNQPFEFVFSDALLAEAGGILQRDLHFDADAICKAYDAIKPIAEQLGVEAPAPRLATFTYTHIAAMGTRIVPITNRSPFL